MRSNRWAERSSKQTKAYSFTRKVKMKEIQLTQGYVALVDDEDFERVSQHKWYASIRPEANNVYVIRKIGRKTQGLHRFILGVEDPKIKVDHRDHNGLNNLRSNLRPTRNQNAQNQRLSSANTSGFKGVSWKVREKKYQAGIKVNGKTVHLGTFSDLLEAACAYDMAAVKYHGEFASTNFAEPS